MQGTSAGILSGHMLLTESYRPSDALAINYTQVRPFEYATLGQIILAEIRVFQAPSTYIRIFLNPQLFPSGFKNVSIHT